MEDSETKPKRVRKCVHPRAADAHIVGPMADRIGKDGKRNLMLNSDEKKVIKRQRLISKIIVLFLDVDNPNRSYQEIATLCGISKSTLIDITKADDFIEAWNNEYIDIGSDPMIKAARMKLQTLATKAARTLENVMDDPDASGAAKVAAAKEILRLTGITEPTKNKSDKSELQDFLRGAGINIENVNINVPLPPGYERVTEVIDSQLRDLPAPEAPDSE